MEKATYTRVEYVGVSSDDEAKKNGEQTKVKVTFIYEDYTPEDLVNRLMVSSSPKVAVQAVLRKMKEIPAAYTYKVTKAGMRAEVSIDALISNMSDIDRAALIEKLMAGR